MSIARLSLVAPCPQCGCERRVTEQYAFGGRDRLRHTLSCGHVVPIETAA